MDLYRDYTYTGLIAYILTHHSPLHSTHNQPHAKQHAACNVQYGEACQLGKLGGDAARQRVFSEVPRRAGRVKEQQQNERGTEGRSSSRVREGGTVGCV
jgi:hypothetical protein